MSTPTTTEAEQLHDALRQVLLRMARLEEELAACEAEHVHYWEPVPVTVGVHRRCAAALREAADELLPSCPSPGLP